jgi:YbgC/YbaW family acyl-CoA thioester hydrolase
MSVFRTSRRVEFCDTDMAGIVHFANFFRYMEFAEVEFLRSLGLNVHMEVDGQKFGFPRVAASCNYLRPARFDDILNIGVRVDRLGTKSVTYAIEFSRAGEVLAEGKVTSVACRVEADHKLTAIPMPAIYRDRVEAFSRGGAGPA